MANTPVRHGSSWRIRWTDNAGERRSEVYASFKDAELALHRHLVNVEEVKRGLRFNPGAHTFGELCDEWINTRAARKRSKRTDECVIRKHLKPAFGELRLSAIGVREIEAFKAKRTELTNNTVNHLLTLLVSMLRHAIDIGWLAVVPKIRKYRIKVGDSSFRYLRNAEEVRRFLQAAKELDQINARRDRVGVKRGRSFPLYATAVYTGMRLGELAGLEWGDIDFGRRLITVQRSYDGPTKGGDARHVLLLDELAPILQAWKLKAAGSRLVFPNHAGEMYEACAPIFQETLKEVLELAGFDRSYITFHCCRHTFASLWMMSGGDVFKLQRLLGHKSVAMTMRYAHLAPEAFSGDYGRLGGTSPAETSTVLHLSSPRRI
jgi:integrase